MKILFLVPYPTNEAPSQRFRFEQYFDHLAKNGFSFAVRPFYSSSAWKDLYKSGNTVSKLYNLLKGFGSRIVDLTRLRNFTYVFIHRECTPAGPPLFEWLIARVFRKKIIYDFDDAIWLTDKTDESWLEEFVRYRRKVSSICRWSYRVSCGNAYLAAYASKFNPNVVIVPTTIDTEHVHNPALFSNPSHTETSIGWTGSHSTLKYLESLTPVIARLQIEFPRLQFVVIADRNPNLTLKNIIYRKWSAETEIIDLTSIDIGLMPLPDDEWAKGKCGFKALQYMAMKIPAVISPVGVNTEIISQGIEGYLCASEEEWYHALKRLITDDTLRGEMGLNGREKVIQTYSVLSNAATFLSLFQ